MIHTLAWTYRPLLSEWLIAALVVAALATLAIGLWRDRTRWLRTRLGLGLLRVVAIAGLGWILLGPSVAIPQPTGDALPSLTVLVDASKSMREPMDGPRGAGERTSQGETTQPTQPSRWQTLQRQWLEKSAIGKLAPHANVRWRRFAGTVEPASAQALQRATPEGEATLLFDALQQVVRADGETTAGLSPGPVLILSDGHDTERSASPQLARQLKKRGQRIYAAPFGQGDQTAQLAVQAWPGSDRVFEDETVTLTADVRHRGYAGRPVRVTLEHEGRVIDQQSITMNQNISRRVTFEVEPSTAPGEASTTRVYHIAVTPADKGELMATSALTGSKQSRRAPVFVEVSNERLQVLLLEGEPYWDSRAFARVLRQHAQIALTAMFQLGDQRKLVVKQGDGPSRSALGALELNTLKQFDVIALGRRIERFFSPAEADRLAQYVRGGGALVLVRGRPVDAEANDTEAARALSRVLEPILPVTWGERVVRDLRLSLTPAGRSSPLFSQDQDALDGDMVLTKLPRMLAATRVARAKAASIVTLQQQPRGDADAMAGLAHMRIGQGRVLAVLSEGLWRWPMRAGGEGQTALATFWSRAVHWLAAGGEFLPGQNWSLSLSPRQPRAGEAVDVTLNSRYPLAGGVTPTLRIDRVGGASRRLTLTRPAGDVNQFTGSFRPTEAGVFRLTVEADTLPSDSNNATNADAPAPSTRLVVQTASDEIADPSPRPEVLRRLVEATGGEWLAGEGPEAMAKHLEALRAARQGEPKWQHVFDRWWVLAIVGLSLALEWAWRQRSGG
jgi:hypothetical protein